MAAKLGSLVALVVALAGQQAAPREPPPLPSGTGRISGVVLAADNGAPVKRANVMIVGYGGVPPRDGAAPRPPSPSGGVTIAISSELAQVRGGMRQAQVTDESGRFEFTDLPAGRYSLAVQPQSGFVRNQRSQSILVTDGQTAKIEFKLARTGAITGRILDESGEPLARVRVSAMRRSAAGGFPSTAGSATTDDLGQFRVFDLPPDDYVVSGTLVEVTYAPESTPEHGYAPTFYPGTTSADAAQAVTVRSGQEAPSVIFSLVRVPMGKVTGTVRDSSGQPIVNTGRGAVGVSVSLAPRGPGGNTSRGSGVRPDGTFVIGSIPPGDYYVFASSTQGTGRDAVREGTFTRVTISGDAQHVDLQLNRGATVSGRVQLEGNPGDIPEAFRRMAMGPARTSIGARPVPGGPPQFFGGNPVTVADDDTFSLTGLRGLLLLTAMGVPGAVVKSILHGADDLSRQPIELTGVEHLKDVVVTMTYETGRIEGMATDARGTPVTEATVVVFSDAPETWFPGSPHVFLTRTMPDDAGGAQLVAPPGMRRRTPGSFASPLLAAGTYYVAAIDSTTGVYTSVPSGREGFEGLKKRATSVTVRAGQTVEVRVRAERQ